MIDSLSPPLRMVALLTASDTKQPLELDFLRAGLCLVGAVYRSA